MKEMMRLVRGLLILMVVLLPAVATAGEIAKVQVGSALVQWDPVVENDGLVLTVARPDESTHRQELAAGSSAVFQLTAGDADGVYT
ncbi:MAG TPA: hypothetical protein VG477_01560, partial [Thermoanaerobaculia bacterium]|nr:hypothetical protein [Thermoanaerobaculia bacterium]